MQAQRSRLRIHSSIGVRQRIRTIPRIARGQAPYQSLRQISRIGPAAQCRQSAAAQHNPPAGLGPPASSAQLFSRLQLAAAGIHAERIRWNGAENR